MCTMKCILKNLLEGIASIGADVLKQFHPKEVQKVYILSINLLCADDV